jgi:CRISPR-associated protein Cmr1
MESIHSPLQFNIRFLAPAFLGDAEQKGSWRTPPFKALLRQYWRMAWARDHGYPRDVAPMLHTEGLLFGSASDGEAGSSRSLLRLRLASWSAGKLTTWSPLGAVGTGGKPGGDAGTYLGYGPVAQKDGGLTKGRAIDAGEASTLGLGFDPRPQGHPTLQAEHQRVRDAIALANLFGTVGGRSRNGWGSFMLEADPALPDVAVPMRPWREALGLEWAHAIGTDDKGALVWQTPVCKDWKEAMRQLAAVRYRVRHQFPMAMDRGLRAPDERHWLAYPATKSSVADWDRKSSGRLPNSLRFKLRPAPGEPGKVVGVVFHVPCRPPREFSPDIPALERIWTKAHQFLDTTTALGLQRIAR